MKADRVEVSWDSAKNKWLVRIIVGEEVIRRYCSEARDVASEALRASALKTAREEGYEVSPEAVTVNQAG